MPDRLELRGWKDDLRMPAMPQDVRAVGVFEPHGDKAGRTACPGRALEVLGGPWRGLAYSRCAPRTCVCKNCTWSTDRVMDDVSYDARQGRGLFPVLAESAGRTVASEPTPWGHLGTRVSDIECKSVSAFISAADEVRVI